MITKISSYAPIQYNSAQVSFKGYSTTSHDIHIWDKNIASPISTMSGDIDIEKSKVKGNVSNMSGMLYVSSSNVEGDVQNISGTIKVVQNSAINGNVNNNAGNVVVKNSRITGDVSTDTGKLLLKDSEVQGVVTAKPENINLAGNNKIEQLVLKGIKKAAPESIDSIKAKLAAQGIFIGSIQNVNYNATKIVTTVNGNSVKTEYIDESDKPVKFKLPKGNKVDIIKFDSDKQGILILEQGVEFLGKVINGVIKRV